MSKAQVGHSALDAVPDINDMPTAAQLADMPDDETRVAFLRAGIGLAERELDAARAQFNAIHDKREEVIAAWDGKLNEAEDMWNRAEHTLTALNRELEALEN